MSTRSILLAALFLASPLALARCSSSGSGGSSSGQGNGSSGGEQNGNSGNGTPTLDDAGTLAVMDSGVGSTMATDAGSAVIVTADASTVSTLAQDFPIAPLHLAPTPGARNADAQVDVELRADGSIYSHGQLLGQLSGRRVLSPSGREILAVATDGTVSLGGTATRVHFRDDGDVLLPTGAVLSIADDGTPVAITPDQQRERAPARVTGFRSDLHRTASLLAVIAAMVSMH